MAKSIEQKYVKQKHIDHIKELPDTYIGSVEETIEERWVFDRSVNRMVKKNIKFIPGLYKIYDELLVNALDHYVRLNNAVDNGLLCDAVPVTIIRIDIDQESGLTTIYNNGDGIDVAIHKTYNKWVPSLIFGDLLTSSNYDKNEKKITGGKNGYGAKLTNIFSKLFTIETVDNINNKKFIQVFKNNMSHKGKPKITKNSSNPYTKISYIPDFERFNIQRYSDDMISIMEKRAYDCAAWTNNKVSVYLNGKKITTNTFEKYINLYVGTKKEHPRAYEKYNDRWEIAATINPYHSFENISFVNGINTTRGGKHVTNILNQITRKIIAYIKKKKKITVKSNCIKDNIMLFVKSIIENPSFDSQTKETLTTAANKFGSKCVISDSFIETLAKSGVMEKAIALNAFKESHDFKKTDGVKRNRLRGIPKLEDANWAGTKKSNQCTLILTEGDSAKAMAVGGFSIIGRDKWGVFPLKGKLLNVRADVKKMIKNEEIANIKKIMGLESDKEYTNINDLRYGRIMILTDQDEDGSHIKGLFFNFIEELWESLFKIDGFIVSMLTPIVKATKGKKVLSFYSLPDYEKWKDANNNGKGYHIKYYKGLGTSTPKEAKQYFKDMKVVTYVNDEKSAEMFDMAFNKKRTNDRKDWLGNYDSENVLNYNKKEVCYTDFINKDLIHFSNSNIRRAIPSIFDGLKPSQRKIMFCAFKRNLTSKEIKVAQLSGYVSEHGAYHHGEASLQGTIINMAQNFVGSNNLNLFEPIGQFGTRLLGGKDAAQPRYIFTKLTELTQVLYNKLDNPLYKYLDDDGIKIEPEYYVPIIPMVLVNGCKGIGTGWSTDIACYNPVDIIKNIRYKMKGKKTLDMIPWYRGFKGTIIKNPSNNSKCPSFISRGIYNRTGPTSLVITELPINTKQSNTWWTDNYKSFLETLLIDKKNKSKKQYLVNYESHSTDTEVKFVLRFKKSTLDTLLKIDEQGKCKFDKIFKMESTITTTNMNLYNDKLQIQHFDTTNDILDMFYINRLKLYEKRRLYMLDSLKNELKLVSAKIRFIMEFISGTIKISNKRKNEIIDQLEQRKYPKLGTEESFGNYEYLIKMPIYNLTKDKIEELSKKKDKLDNQIDILTNKSGCDLWNDDLKDFLIKYKKTYNIKKKIKFKKKN